MSAAEGNHNLEVIRVLLEAGARVNDQDKLGRTPLILAAAKNLNPGVLLTLLEAGAQIDQKDKSGLTPLMWAAGKNQNPECVTALLKAGANAQLRSAFHKTAPLISCEPEQEPLRIQRPISFSKRLLSPGPQMGRIYSAKSRPPTP